MDVSVTSHRATLQGITDDIGACARQVHVSFAWPGFEAVVVPLKLLPGLPRSLQLLPGHPFTSQVVYNSIQGT